MPGIAPTGSAGHRRIQPEETQTADPVARDIVLVGASGDEGLRQLVAFLSALPPDLPASVLVVLHRPVGPRSYLQEVLGKTSMLPVRVAFDQEPLEHGVCYIGEPDRHLAVGPGLVAELQVDHVFHNRTIDLRFGTAARRLGPRVIGVVFSGALWDGSQGLLEIARAGGAALVQDPEQVMHGDMPANALAAAPEAEILGSAVLMARRVAELVSGGW